MGLHSISLLLLASASLQVLATFAEASDQQIVYIR